MLNNPLVSVIMPVYNAEKYLDKTILSVLNQTYKNFEFIIINDGSIDRSEDIILSFKDDRIKYVKNEKNLQIVKTLNKALSIASGEYIARMDADDINYPNRFELQVNFLEKNKDISICGSWVKTIGKMSRLWKYPIHDEKIKAHLLFHSPLVHPSVMTRKKIFEEHKYKDEFNKAEDYALWVELSKKFKMYNIPKPLLLYRLHNSQTNKEVQKIVTNKIRKKLLYEIYSNISEQEMKMFFDFIDKKNNIDLFLLNNLLISIIYENTKVNRLPSEEFANYVTYKYFEYVLINYSFVKSYKIFYKSELFKFLKLDTDYIKLILKKIIGKL